MAGVHVRRTAACTFLRPGRHGEAAPLCAAPGQSASPPPAAPRRTGHARQGKRLERRAASARAVSGVCVETRGLPAMSASAGRER